jgi:hypothetical protein
VYINTASTPVVAPIGVNPTVICLIGAGVGYNTFQDIVTFSGSTPVTLTKSGINASSIVVTGYIPDPNASNQALPHTFLPDITGGSPQTRDYSVNQTGSGASSVTTLTKEGSGTISTTYPQATVSYQYTDASYYGLHFFSDYTSFTNAYGPALDPTTGALVSPLSLAAQVAMQNGANQLYAIALEGGSNTLQQQFADAYALLSSTNTDANIIVPLWNEVTDPTQLAGMLATLKAFVEGDATNQGILRMAFVGFDEAYAPAISDLATLAVNVASERVVMAWPNQLNFFNGVTSQTQILDGFYLATAYAGLLSALPPQMPLTQKYPQGFSGVPIAISQTLTTTAKNQLSSSGVTVCNTDRRGRLVVRHGLTTDYVGGVLAREISLVRAEDALFNLVDQNLLTAQLIGQPIITNTVTSTNTTLLQVRSIVTGALDTATTSALINGYNNVVVTEQQPPSGDPTIIQVQFAYLPPWPLNYVLVSFSVDTTTGQTNLTASGNTTG